MKGARGGVLTPYRESDRWQIRNASTLSPTVPNDIALSPAGFSNGSVFGASQICLPPHLPSSFSGRDRRDVNDSVAERGTVWWRRSVVGIGEETCVFRKFPRSPMCKYLSRVSGPAPVACMHMYDRSYTYATRMHTQPQSYYARKPQYASGNCVNTCIKMSTFACLHPRPRYPPSGPLLRTPFVPLYRDTRVPICRRVPPMTMSSTSSAYVCAPCENVFGSGTCQPNVNPIRHVVEWLRSWPTSADGSAIMYPCRRRSTLARDSRCGCSLKELRTLFSNTDSCDFSPNCLPVPSTRSRT